jgi:energy-coupling factor transporter transmembrane protein EcfT
MAEGQTTEISSPDGRRWTITTGRTRRHLKDSKDVPFFAAHVVATIVLILFFIFVLKLPWSGWLEWFIPAIVIIWFVGFIGSSLHPTIEANTPGPPPEHRKWTVTKRFAANKAIKGVREAIQQGQISVEPEGTRLTEI